MHIPNRVKIGSLFVGCLATTEQAGELLRMAHQPALQHVVMTMGTSLTAVALFNNTTFASIQPLALAPGRCDGCVELALPPRSVLQTVRKYPEIAGWK